MMNEHDLALCQRILEKCQQQHWYGGDEYNRYALATEEELSATEQELGFPLPAFLRLLYCQVANGGFGPGYGLIGALGGFDEAGNIVEMYQHHAARGQLIDLEQYESASSSNAELELSHTSWPRYMLYLCDWGEARVSCLDCVTGRVFLARMGEEIYPGNRSSFAASVVGKVAGGKSARGKANPDCPDDAGRL